MDNQTTDLDFSSLRGASAFSDVIVSAFATALSALGSNEVDLEQRADNVAREIFTRAPLRSDNQRDDEAVALQQQACGILLEIAKFVPHHHRGQLLLVRAVAKLEERCQHGSYVVLLGQELRDRWIGPIPHYQPPQTPTLTSASPDPTISDEDDSDEEEYYTPDEWLNLNSFAARVFGARIADFDSFAVWQLRTALEQDGQSASSALDTQVRVACEWIVHGGGELWRRCSSSFEVDEGVKSSYNSGPLFSGPHGFSVERWAFWKDRLRELRGGLGELARSSVDEALKRGTACEKDLELVS